jgi:hypothetical protein
MPWNEYITLKSQNSLLNNETFLLFFESEQKAINFVESNYNVKVTKLNLSKFKSSFQMWSTMMTYYDEPLTFSRLLTDSDVPIDVFTQLVKSFTGLQRHHTIPALGLAAFERIPSPDGDFFLERVKELRNELKEILGLLTHFFF